MKKYNSANERIKRRYLSFLKDAKGNSELTLDAATQALGRFEQYTRFRDFKTFHFEQAKAFKRHLSEQTAQRSGKPLSKSTIHATLNHLKRFFQWLAREPGYKSRIQYSEAEYFNLSDKDVRVATAKRHKKSPTIEQTKHVIDSMKIDNDIDKRNRALVAFTLLTAARDNAIASIKLKHIDLFERCFYQDAREVKTKFSKTFTTFFFPVGEEIFKIFEEWVLFLREVKLWGNDDPLFPATRVEAGNSRRFEVVGLKQEHWNTTSSIRKIFRDAFTAAGLQYYNPHSLRDTLTIFGEQICQTPEEFKAWSQNLGHEKVMTTFSSYGEVPARRQGEIIQNLGNPRVDKKTQEAFMAFLKLNLKTGKSD
jgi:integrase